MVLMKRSSIALARGARAGVRMILTSTTAKAAVNLASRSRIRNRKECPAEVRVAWVAHADGCDCGKPVMLRDGQCVARDRRGQDLYRFGSTRQARDPAQQSQDIGVVT